MLADGAGDGTVAAEMQTLGANLTAVLIEADDKEQCQLAATATLYTYKLLAAVGYNDFDIIFGPFLARFVASCHHTRTV